jgi:hypothetical protein
MVPRSQTFYGRRTTGTTFGSRKKSEILSSVCAVVRTSDQSAACAFGIISIVQIAAGRMYMEAR